MGDTINTGIIGFGLSGKVFHAPFIHTHPGFRLSVIVERHHHHSNDIYPYIDVIQDYKYLLEDDSIDLIVVATPNVFHYSMVRECLEAGKHVVVEKPFVPTSSEADELINISKRTEKNIFVYQNRRWDGDFLTIKKLLDEGRLGDIKYYEAHFDRYSPDIKPGAWRDDVLPGSGILFDLGSHLIDQALCLFGLPESIKATLRSERAGSPVDDHFNLELYYPDKAVVLTAGMMVKNIGPRFILDGSKGSFSKWGLDPQEAGLKAGNMPIGDKWGADDQKNWGTLGTGEAVPQELIRIPTQQGNYMGFYDNVYEVMFKNKPQAVLPRQARDVIFIIEKAFESNKTGRTIKVKQTL